jgi:hypothetical protein
LSKPTGGIAETLRSLDEYWFGYGSPVSLGIFRILIGALAVLNQLFLLSQWDSWFSEKGYTPAWLGQLFLFPSISGPNGIQVPRIDLLNGITNPTIIFAFLVLMLIAALLTCFGLFTRASTIFLAMGIISLHHRNAIILHGGDTVIRLAAIYLAISPCGNACSVDRVVRLWKGKESRELASISLWPQRLIAYNVALIYFTTTWLKWFGSLWRNGTATYYPSRLPEFYRFPVPTFVNEFPMVYVTTYGTLLTEFALATLVFIRPCRKWVLLAGVLMHGYIEYSMNIPLFSYLMISGYIAFYDGEEVSAWAKQWGQRLSRWHTAVRVPTPLAKGPAAALAALDPLDLVEYRVGGDTMVTKAEGRKSAIRSIGAWPIAWLPGVWRGILRRALEGKA